MQISPQAKIRDMVLSGMKVANKVAIIMAAWGIDFIKYALFGFRPFYGVLYFKQGYVIHIFFTYL